MADPIGSFSGLASGIQWRDMVDQIMALERARRVDPLSSQITLASRRTDAWTSFQAATQRLADAVKTLRDGTAFGSAFQTSVSGTAAAGRALLTASAAAGAVPGSYAVEVLDLARAEKLSGAVVASATEALGVAGDFLVNGRTVTLLATDSLHAVRDKINAANTGSSPSGVAATVLSTGTGAHRLVLTSATAGTAGIELVEGTTGALAALGLTDGTRQANLTADGGTQSFRFNSVTSAIATMLGVTSPPPSSITVGGRTISVDLSVDSLSSIVARIQAAGGGAELVTEGSGTAARTRLVVDGAVTADTPDGERALELLGFVQAGRGAVAQSVVGVSPLADALGATATAATPLTELQLGGAPVGLAAGDTFSIRGTRGDGTAVNVSFIVTAGDTLQSLLDRLNDAGAFGGGARPATATLDGGRIRLTDGTGGDSQLAFSLTATSAATGESLSLGRAEVETVGRLREVVDGSDARVRVDGVLVTRATNSIADAIGGVTLNLQAAEPGTTATVTVARDTEAMVKAVQAFAAAYNDVQSAVKTLSAPGAPLAANGTLRSAMSSLTGVLLTGVDGLADGALFTRGALVGVALSRTGTLEVDAAALRTALGTNFTEVQALFGTAGTATSSLVRYAGAGADAQPGRYAVDVTAPATRAAVTGAGFGGTYVDDGTADTLTVTDTNGGATATVELRHGDTLDAIVTRLNAEFDAQGVRVRASADGGQLRLESSEYGSLAGFSVAAAGGGADGTAQLGLAAGTWAGTDVAGTIGGHAATGRGQLLTGAEGTPTAGLAVEYLGDAAGAAGEIRYVLGIGGLMKQATDAILRTGDGVVAAQTTSIEASVTRLEARVENAEQLIERRREALIRQFTAMEAALGRMQAQGSWLTQQLSALNTSRE